MFLQNEVNAFMKQWQMHTSALPLSDSGEPLISLDAFARKSGIAPLELWQAASTGKPYRGIALPVAVKSYGSKLMFSAASVELFIAEYKRTI